MQINPYLLFDGQCETAFQHYAQVLGGEITMLSRFGDGPGDENASPEMRDRVMHVHMTVGDQTLMGSDSPSQYFEKAGGMSVSVNVDDVTKGETIFKALSEGGIVKMPYEETFWAKGFGMCVDRFGTPWIINAGNK